MTVHRIFVSSEQRISGHRGDFIFDTTKEFARFEGRRVMCAVEYCNVVRYTSNNDNYVKNADNPSGLLLECPDMQASNTFQSWNAGTSCALAMLQNYATAGIYGLEHDLPYCRRSHMGILVDYNYIKRLGTMHFRLRRCCTSLTTSGDFKIVDANDSLEPWAFQLVFWEPCPCSMPVSSPPFSYSYVGEGRALFFQSVAVLKGRCGLHRELQNTGAAELQSQR
jgi:hypothetical protein